MKENAVSYVRRISSASNVAAVMIAGVALGWFGFSTDAQEQASTPLFTARVTPSDLEKAFWLCDYVGTTRSVDTDTAAFCSMITEELKTKNFNGDFEAMLVWWKANKPAEHQAFEAEILASADTSGRSIVIP